MALPTKRGVQTIKAWAAEPYWIYCEITLPQLQVSIDNGSPFLASSGIDDDGVQGWTFMVAGPECEDPPAGSQMLTAYRTHVVRWWSNAGGRVHAGEGQITIDGGKPSNLAGNATVGTDPDDPDIIVYTY